ncbi:ATP-binding protein [Kineococcus rubinsiae]|uniref:ATP-binding protein n=1 Tax=Kineococcus rubinsiae TaxID=2609562 RepID=UPI0014305CD3|nr:ATP-binding protein [Kineococcus rubinsiae]NIZ93134.1 ATP-binding protein [Kineococcus rubinsiae]
MDDNVNPYTPGSGTPPAELVGRAAQLTAATVLAQRTANGLTTRSPMLSGLRGVGKTVLLNALRGELDGHQWLTVKVEAQVDRDARAVARRQLERGLVAGARSLASRAGRVSGSLKKALSTIGSFSLSVGPITASLDPVKGRADSGVLEFDLSELVSDVTPALAETGAGFAVFVDEIQDLDPTTLTALLTVQHEAAQQKWPFQLFGAGLPSVPSVLADARSYAERQFDYQSIGALSPQDAAEALVGPAREAGVTWHPEALDEVVATSAGYPYFVQEFGAQAWRLAPGPRVITLPDAHLAREAGTEALDAGFFRSRWDRATKAEQRLLRAMAVDGDAPSQMPDLVSRLDRRRQSDLSVARRDLIGKGLVYAPARGELAFTVPHMAAYIRRQHGLD